MRRSSELQIHVDRTAETSLTQQLFERLRAAVHDGRLRPGDPLPASRRFAETLDVSRTVVLNAYERLRQEGYLDTRHGSGTFVRKPVRPAAAPAARAPVLPPVLQPAASARGGTWPSSARAGRPPSPFIDFLPFQPALDRFPLRQWRRFVDDAYARADSGALSYGEVDGAPRLRVEVARRLRLTRAIPIGADQVAITGSASGALGILARQLLGPGDRVAVENPCHPSVPQIMRSAGATVLPVPVDEHGLRVDLLAAEPRHVTAVYVTPTHHFPTGAQLAQARRQRLIAWANEHDAIIIEHDYDDEFCFGGPCMPALDSVAPDRVVYVASFSKTMFPALSIGHVVLPPALRAGFLRVKRIVDPASTTIEQHALADFISTGAYAHHLKEMRALYQRRCTVLREALERHCGGLLVPPAETAGLTMYVRSDGRLPGAELLRRARAYGVGVYSAADCHLDAPDSGAPLLMGYGCVASERIEEGARRLGRALLGRRAGTRRRLVSRR